MDQAHLSGDECVAVKEWVPVEVGIALKFADQAREGRTNVV